MKRKIVIIVGQTTTGKSEIAIGLAKKFNGEIINADSMQVYKFMDIGTSKVSKEESKIPPHHLIDIVLPSEDYNTSKFVEDARKKIEEINVRGNNPFIVGGTGLYIRCLLGGIFKFKEDTRAVRKKLIDELERDGIGSLYSRLKELDPKSASKLSANDKQRIIRALEVFYVSGIKISKLQELHKFGEKNYLYLKIGLKIEKKELLEKIRSRVQNMFEHGFLREVENLLNKGYKSDLKALNSIGYKEVIQVLDGKMTEEEAQGVVYKRTKEYAKRQMTWFKKDLEIQWFHPRIDREKIVEAVSCFLR